MNLSARRTRLPGDVWLIGARSLVAALILLTPFSTAFAHAHLVKAEPAAGAHLATAPSQLMLTFSEKPIASMSQLTLLGPSRNPVALRLLDADATGGRMLHAAIIGALPAGRYTVQWRLVGDDGHPVTGEYTFTIDGPSVVAGVSPTPPSAPPRVLDRSVGREGEFGVSSLAYVTIRVIQFSGIMLLIGVLTVRVMILPRAMQVAAEPATFIAETSRRLTLLVQRALLVVAAATLARLAAQHAAVFGLDARWSTETLRALLLDSLWGWAWMLAVLAICVGWLSSSHRHGGRPFLRVFQAVAILALVATLSLSGHAAAAPRRAVAVTLDIVHLLGAGGWVGSLAVLFFVLLPSAAALPADERHGTVARLVIVFSPVALGCALLVGVTGAFNAWLHLGSLSALWESTYGQTLLRKLGLLALMVTAGAYNWRRVLPRLGDHAGTTRLRRSAMVELIAALLVIVATAVLVVTPPATEAARAISCDATGHEHADASTERRCSP